MARSKLSDIMLNAINEQLTKSDIDAIEQYAEFDYIEINSELRMPTEDSLSNKVKILSKALNKLPNYKGEVTRFQLIYPPTKLLLERNIGKTVTFKSFTSASKIENLSKKKSTDSILKLISKTGKDISKISSRPEEQEVVFDKGTRFTLTKIKNDVYYFTES